jgi:hypothetical protein
VDILWSINNKNTDKFFEKKMCQIARLVTKIEVAKKWGKTEENNFVSCKHSERRMAQKLE